MTEMEKKDPKQILLFSTEIYILGTKGIQVYVNSFNWCNVNYLQDTLKIGILQNHLLE